LGIFLYNWQYCLHCNIVCNITGSPLGSTFVLLLLAATLLVQNSTIGLQLCKIPQLALKASATPHLASWGGAPSRSTPKRRSNFANPRIANRTNPNPNQRQSHPKPRATMLANPKPWCHRWTRIGSRRQLRIVSLNVNESMPANRKVGRRHNLPSQLTVTPLQAEAAWGIIRDST
jgi:hypothetical protein